MGVLDDFLDVYGYPEEVPALVPSVSFLERKSWGTEEVSGGRSGYISRKE